MFRVWGWEFYNAIEEHCRTNTGYGMYSDVQGNGHIQDQTESYFSAETLKYFIPPIFVEPSGRFKERTLHN